MLSYQLQVLRVDYVSDDKQRQEGGGREVDGAFRGLVGVVLDLGLAPEPAQDGRACVPHAQVDEAQQSEEHQLFVLEAALQQDVLEGQGVGATVK